MTPEYKNPTVTKPTELPKPPPAPSLPEQPPPPPKTCPHITFDNICGLASWIADKECTITPEICRACVRCDNPQDINEVVLSLAGVKESTNGPGTTLHNTITWFVAQPAGCSCGNRVDIMNAWGKERCLQELPTILSWLRESALDNNIPYSEYVISIVVKNILKHMC